MDFVKSKWADVLSTLAAGAGQHLFSVDNWAELLGNADESKQFIEQMRDEWLPLEVPNEFCQQMIDFVRNHISWHIGWPHIWAHTLRVTASAVALAPEADVDIEHAFVLGMFHDIGKLDEIVHGFEHELIGAQMLQKTLNGHYSRAQLTLMANVIAKKANAVNPYARVLHNADKLDKIGATGIARRVSTHWGAEHISLAVRRVQREAEDFPRMSFSTSRRLAKEKIAFTEQFFSDSGL